MIGNKSTYGNYLNATVGAVYRQRKVKEKKACYLMVLTLVPATLLMQPFLVQIQYCRATKALAHPCAQDDNTLAGLEEWSQVKVRVLIFWTGANKAI
jgi:hypothetical protein